MGQDVTSGVGVGYASPFRIIRFPAANVVGEIVARPQHLVLLQWGLLLTVRVLVHDKVIWFVRLTAALLSERDTDRRLNVKL